MTFETPLPSRMVSRAAPTPVRTVSRGVVRLELGTHEPNAQGLGLLLYTPSPPETAGTIRVGVATHKGVRIALWESSLYNTCIGCVSFPGVGCFTLLSQPYSYLTLVSSTTPTHTLPPHPRPTHSLLDRFISLSPHSLCLLKLLSYFL